MIQLPLCVAIITSLLFISSVKSVTTSVTGAGTVYTLSVTQVLEGIYITVVYEITSAC